MNKSEFITVVAQKSGQPKALTADIINAALEAITETCLLYTSDAADE